MLYVSYVYIYGFQLEGKLEKYACVLEKREAFFTITTFIPYHE